MTDNTPTTPPRRLLHRRGVLIALFTLTFIAGGISGGAIAFKIVSHRFHLRSRSPKDIPQRITMRMKHKLDLTDTQAEQVQEILTRRFAAIMDIRRKIYPMMKPEFDQTLKEVSNVLNPDQAEKWKQWFTKRFSKHWPGINKKPPPK